MDTEKILGVIAEHLAKAEQDLQACRRGSNYGRVAALRELWEALQQEES